MADLNQTQASAGLTSRTAAHRLAADGPNELPASRARRFVAIVADVLAEPMFLLLLAAVAIYLVLGDVREALVLAASMLAVIAIAVYQQHRTERALEALRDLSSPRALVIRDGVEKRIPGREVVRGDVVLLREGDRVPADGLLRAAVELAVDESLLTGESLPVDKSADPAAQQMGRPGEAIAAVYSGTLVVHGHGVAEVLATGPRSEIGRIGSALALDRIRSDASAAGDAPGGAMARSGRASRCAPSSRSPTASCAAIGPRRSWPASRWRWEYCRRNFRSS